MTHSKNFRLDFDREARRERIVRSKLTKFSVDRINLR